MTVLGIDTSNYTTSLSLVVDGEVTANLKKSVYVKEHERGVRQSDALFCHIKNLPELCETLGELPELDAVGYSSKPRDVEGSYMPCFLAGELLARGIAANRGLPLFAFSHQAGHIRAALYSANADGRNGEDLRKSPFLAFHVSGGTTEMLLVKENKIEKIGGTEDLTAGQAIDRVGVLLGLQFPCGAALEKLALDAPVPKVKPCVRGTVCHISGLENQASKMILEGRAPEEVAAYTIEFVRTTVEKPTESAFEAYGRMPVLYAGGVMSCSIIRKSLEGKFGGRFAEPTFSADNAAGNALLTYDGIVSQKRGKR